MMDARHYSPIHLAIGLSFGLALSCTIFAATRQTLELWRFNRGLMVNDGLPESDVITRVSMVEDTVGALMLATWILFCLAPLGLALATIAGRVRITIREAQAEVFVGIGRIGRRLRFEPRKVTNIRIVESERRGKGASPSMIAIELADGRKLEFGALLPERRRRFLAGALHEVLMSRK